MTLCNYHKVGVSFDVISHVALDEKVVHTMSCDGSVVGMVNSTVSDIGAVHRSTQVKVDGVATKSKCLTTVSNLGMLNSEASD